jgi:hypothetical protein
VPLAACLALAVRELQVEMVAEIFLRDLQVVVVSPYLLGSSTDRQQAYQLEKLGDIFKNEQGKHLVLRPER